MASLIKMSNSSINKGKNDFSIVKRVVKFLFVLTCLIMPSSFVYADELILNVIIDSDGKALVYGSYNGNEEILPEDIVIEDGSITGTTDYFTNKVGPEWTANVTFLGTIDYCLINIYIPSEAVIKDIVSGAIDKSIEITEDSFKISFEAWNATFPSLIILYELEENDEEKEDSTEFLIYVAVGALLASFGVILSYMMIKKSPKAKKDVKIDESKLQTIMNTLNEREQEIVTALIKLGGLSTQRELQSYLDIPRASLARIIEHLYAKKVVNKWKYGKTNKVQIHESLLGG